MVGDHKRKMMPMLPKWYIVVLANIIGVSLFLDVMITCKIEKVLEMSHREETRIKTVLHFTYGIFKKLLD
jgi:hypothetical protein